MAVTLACKQGDVTFVSVYAPHSGKDSEIKDKFYEELSAITQSLKGSFYIGGDCNARIYHVRDTEHDILGTHIVTKSREAVDNLSDQTKENRNLFIGFCRAHGLKIVNSLFHKPACKLVTYLEKNDTSGIDYDLRTRTGPPYDATKYAQLDYFITHGNLVKTVKDCQSRIDVGFDSDHFVVEICVSLKPKALLKKNMFKCKKYRKPNTEQWVKYNSHVASFLEQRPRDLALFRDALQKAAELSLDIVDPEQKKDYISKTTWDKIEHRDKIAKEGATNKDVRKLTKDIAKSARNDKKEHLVEQFNENPRDLHKKDLWKSVKGLKKKFSPQYVKMKNRDGKHVPLIKRAEAIAEYLEKEHWSNEESTDEHPYDTPICFNANADENDFSDEELNVALKLAKCKKEPGPDGIQMELLKWLNKENRTLLLALFNGWWRHKDAPDDLFLARVVPIFKKGETDNAANYRPISLLSSFYKVYMILIRERIQKAIDKFISKTQYGFREGKSTSHALYILRRVQDYAEMKAAKLNMAFLDWEKAFDKVKHDKLMIALKRMGLSKHYIEVIQNCYANPMFFVRDNYGISDTKRQNSGIRQGCPLSPYLFLLVMTCIDFDVRNKSSGHVRNNRLPGIDFDIIYYADDTVLFSQSTRGLNELLRHTEQISKQYGLKLNRTKCVGVSMNNEANIHFDDGTPLERQYETTYLGNELNREVNIKHEITNKIHEVRKTLYKLDPYWKATNASKKWKLIIFDAIIRSKLLYGLETLHLTEAMAKKLDVFQLKGLRKILNMTTTFINRNNTNARVLEEATKFAYPRQGDMRQIRLFSEQHRDRKAKLLGHIARAPNEDPLRQITFQPDSCQRIEYGKKRIGKPRQNWIHQTKKHIYVNQMHMFSYNESKQQDRQIFKFAKDRKV